MLRCNVAILMYKLLGANCNRFEQIAIALTSCNRFDKLLSKGYNVLKIYLDSLFCQTTY